MNEQEQDFDRLRRLLALKRHEAPPPGYFENLPGEIRARLRAGEGNQSAQSEMRMPWLLRLLSAFEAKPAFAGVFASALCMLLLGAVVSAERTPEMVSLPIHFAQSPDPMAMVSAQTEPAPPGFITSTNPVFNAQFASAQLGVGSPLAGSQLGGSLLMPSGTATLQPLSLTLP